MNTTALKVHALIFLLLAGMAVIQFRQIQSFDQQEYQLVHSYMEDIIRLDARSEESMLLLQNHRLNNYDQLTTDTAGLQQTFTRLNHLLRERRSLQPQLDNLHVSIRVQTAAVDRFKSELGILRNSERYLPQLISQITQTQPAMTTPLMQLNRDVFQYLLEPDNDRLQQSIARQQQQLGHTGLEQLHQHIAILLRTTAQLREQVDQVIHCGTPENAYLLVEAYDALHGKNVLNMEKNRFWLIGLVSVLLAYLIILLYSLIRSMHQLQSSHDELSSMHRQVEEDLSKRKEAEKRYKTLVHASSAAIMTYADNHFISANPATLEMFGIDNETEILGISATDVSPPQQPDGRDSIVAASSYVAIALQQGSCGFEWVLQHRDGTLIPTYVQLTTIELNRQRVLQAVITDLSELYATKQEKERLAVALEYSAEAVLITDTDARISYANSAFESLSGYTPAEVYGRFVSILRSDAIDTSVYIHMLEQLNSGKLWRGELPIRRKDGSDLLTARSISPIFDANGTVTGHVCMLHDISAEKEQARKLEHTQRLESLGVLAGGIAHDFNNILTSIMGNAAMAERSLDDTSPAKDKLARIESATQRAAELCKQMLAYSGKGKFVVKTIHLSRQVEEMMRLMEVSIEKNVVIKYHLAENLPPVEVDVAQIQQVILNLITNANEAIGDHSGVISLSTGVMHADEAYLQQTACSESLTAGRYTYIEVSDTGCGMDAATMQRIFDPFFTTKFTGRGLGMSAVLGIVRGHHGTLKIYSEPGEGTTFKVLLPVSGKPVSEEKHPSDKAGWQPKGTILIVDDEDTIREVAALMLEAQGFSCLTAENGIDAVQIYRLHQHNIVAVLLDMTMPKMDGKACFRKLRNINPEVQVVLSSGYSEEDATGHFKSRELAGFIQKPYTPETLAQVMQNLLSPAA